MGRRDDAGPAAGSAAIVVDFMYPNPAGIESKLPNKPPDEENVHEGVRRNTRRSATRSMHS